MIETIPLDYTINYDKNCYIVKIPYSFYIREDLYRNNDDIYVGISAKLNN